jgi:hypothetical protein
MYSGMAFSFLLRTVQSWIIRINTSQKQIIHDFFVRSLTPTKKTQNIPETPWLFLFVKAPGCEEMHLLKRWQRWNAWSVAAWWNRPGFIHFIPLALWATDSCSFNPKSYVLFDSPCGRIPFFGQLPQLFSGEFPIFFCNLLIPVRSIYLTSYLTPNLCQVNSN